MSSTLGLSSDNTSSRITGSASTSSAAPPPWRQFPFFDASVVKDIHDLNSTPDIFKATPEISTITRSTAGMLVADIHGSIHLLNRDFEALNSWVAHVGGRVTHMAERRGVLVTLGEEDSVRSPLLKIWDLQNKDKKTGAPLLLRSTKVQVNNRPHPVTTLALSSTLSHLAIGLGDGTVILYKHLDQSLASGGAATLTASALTNLPKARVIFESPAEPITGLGFREPVGVDVEEGEVPYADARDTSTSTSQAQPQDKDPETRPPSAAPKDDDPRSHWHFLFIVTTSRVLCYQVSGRGSGGAPTVVDEVGAGLGCAVMDRKKRNVVVAREEAVYAVGVEGREGCWAYEGHKSSIHTHASYLLILSPPFVPSPTSASATVRNLVALQPEVYASQKDVVKLTIFDLENKLVAYTGAFEKGVRGVVSQWGCVWVLGCDGELTKLTEKPTPTKLTLLFQKGLYQLALSLAHTQNLPPATIAEIHKQYGDALYAKGDFDGAMGQYVRTVGWVSGGEVVRKYLDAQRIHNLVTYLQELHAQGLANADHTTLLLNAYTKLKDVARLDQFVKAEARGGKGAKSTTDSSNDPDDLPFDLATAIRVCRQAGYFEHAAYLAK
ncbi:hypothetical protein CVT26_002623, partial [Gymnopilus dilepis]